MLSRSTPGVAVVSAAALSEASKLALLPERERESFLAGLSDRELAALRWDWRFWGRPAQMEPGPLADGSAWVTWMILAGRGFGKTRAGSEWIRENVCGRTPLARGRAGRIALVAETAADARDVMVQGPSGILATSPPDFRPRYVKSDRALYWPNGAVGLTFSAEDPEQLRGPEHDLAWSDELAKWRYAQETWDMLQFGLRIGERPRQLVTTTPRPIPIVRQLLTDPACVVTKGSTFDNKANLATSFVRSMEKKYVGTRIGRQELEAEILADVRGALWSREMLDRRSSANPLGAGMSPEEAARLPVMRRVVVGVDPSGTSGEEDDGEPNDVGILVAALGVDGLYYVLDDATTAAGPAAWGKEVVSAYHRNQGDLIVGEENFGGAMVEYVIRTQDRRVPYRSVRASRGKIVRAEPVAALYEQGRVRHVGTFAELEDQMCNMTRNGYEGRGSPDRVDALVWAITDLLIQGEPPRAGVGRYGASQ